MSDAFEHRDFDTKERAALSEKGQAMPGGGYPIRNRQDLKNAIQAFGRATNKVAAKAWIIKRARALDLTDLLPESWRNETEHANNWEVYLQHHGVKGMRWGVRRSRSTLAKVAKARTGKSVKELSDDELRSAVNRMNLEQQYTRLSKGSNKSTVSAGAKIAAGLLGSVALKVAKTQIQSQATKQVSSAFKKRASRKIALKRLRKLG